MRVDDHWEIELEHLKTDINLVEFAINPFGYIVGAKKSSPNSDALVFWRYQLLFEKTQLAIERGIGYNPLGQDKAFFLLSAKLLVDEHESS